MHLGMLGIQELYARGLAVGAVSQEAERWVKELSFKSLYLEVQLGALINIARFVDSHVALRTQQVFA